MAGGKSEPERSESAPRVTATQARRFRLRRHRLSERAPRSSQIVVLGELGGAQAQLLSAAELALWARVQDLEPGVVDRGLWEDRTMARAWCMRRTLHLVPARDVAMFVRGTARRAEKEIRWAHNAGISPPVLDRTLHAVLAALDRPRTRAELAHEVARRLNVPLRTTAGGGGWGNRRERPWLPVDGQHLPVDYLLHLVGASGVLCSGPGHGSEASYVRADAWIPRWRDLAPERAEEELLRRYLRAYGPATPADFMAWTRVRLVDAREIWDRCSSELAPVRVDGELQWLLREDLDQVIDADEPASPARLLPFFDSFLLGHLERDHLLGAKDRPKVYRPQGWVAPVLLVDGVVRGVWQHAMEGRRLKVRLRPFRPLDRTTVRQLRSEADDLGRFLRAETVAVSTA